MKTAITKTKKILAVLMCVFMLSSFAIPLASAEEVENNLEWIFENDAQKTLTVPSTDTPNTVTLPEAKLLSGEGTITYELCADSKGETSFSRIDLAFEDPTKPVVTVKNSVKDYIKDNGGTKITVHAKATAKKDNVEIASKIVELTVENYKVHVTFLGRFGSEVLGEDDIYYGTSAASAAEGLDKKITDFAKPNQWYHYGFNGWFVDSEDKSSTFESVKGDTTFRPSQQYYNHEFENEVTKKATCTEEGKMTYTCKSCGYSYTEVIKASHDLDKSEGSGYEYKAATCTEDGYEKGTCKVCNQEINKTITKTGHDYEVTEPEVLPTCTTAGRTEGKKCKNCQNVIESVEKPATGHTPEVIEAKEPTCTEPGNKAGIKCAVCPAIIKPAEEIPATGHKMTASGYLAPTCTEKGHSAGKMCEKCGETETAIIYPAMGHDMVTDVEEVAATCTEPGRTKGEHCTRCDYKEVSEEQAALGHIEVIDKATAATCEEPAKTEGKHCGRDGCGVTLVAQETVGEKLGHNMIVYEVAVAATCKEPGKTAGKKCTRCDYKEEPQETALANHEYEIFPGEEDKEPTCTEKGYRAARYCVNCDAKLPGEELAANGHVDADGDNQCDVCGAEITYVDPSKDCPHFCHSNNIFKKILWKIVRSFYKLLGIQKVCDCGVLHYN